MNCSKKIVTFLISCVLISTGYAQTANIKGKIIDSNTLQPIPFANVFLNNTTLGTTSELSGEFVLKNVKQPAQHDLVISFVGYETYKTKINLTGDVLEMGVIRLKPSEIELSTVEVKGTKDVEWEKKMKRFKKIFLGDDPMAAQCVITNSWVIDFQDEGAGNNLIAFAKVPIEIENNALGYKVTFYLVRFVANSTSYAILGNARFEIMKSSDPKVVKQWDLNREKSYFGSSQHLFRSILEKHIYGEGFNLYTPIPGLVNTNERSSSFSQDFGKTIISSDTVNLLSLSSKKDIYQIGWKEKLEVHYRKKKEQATVYNDIRYPISWITLKKNIVLINKEGIPLNSSDIVISGAMSENRVAKMLPLDYLPANQIIQDIAPESKQDIFDRLYEKVYVHTDRPYYYPGETIWFKGYMSYNMPAIRDSLSRTVYVEFINGDDKKVVLSKTLKIDSGAFYGDFVLPDTLKSSTYFLRAYTSWNRNYGDDHLFTLYVPILNLNEKPVPGAPQKVTSSDRIKISTNKEVYNPREEIDMLIQLQNDDDDPVASSLSISVTDANQVISVKTNASILEDLPIKKVPKPISKPTYPIEYGIRLSGQVVNEKGKAESGILNIFDLRTASYFTSEIDDKGFFSLSGLDFYALSRFSFKLARQPGGKLREVSNVKITPQQVPPILFSGKVQPIALETMSSSQRESSTLELSSDTRLLNEVIVNATKLEESKKRPYGKPDYIIKGADINTGYGNLLQVLPGKVPGLIVRQDPNGQWLIYVQRSSTSSISNAKSVLVMIDDAFVGGSAADVLSTINPATVESIEVKTGINVLYGSAGGSGIVSVYTKKGVDSSPVQETQSFVTAKGYDYPRIFPDVQHSDSTKTDTSHDYRSLIHWDPFVSTGPKSGTASLTFHATDLTGTYRVIVQGVTRNGVPIQAEHMILVNKKND